MKILLLLIVFTCSKVFAEDTYLLSCKYRSQVNFNYIFTQNNFPDRGMIMSSAKDSYEFVMAEPIIIQVVLSHIAKRPGKYVIYGDETINVPHVLLVFTVSDTGKIEIIYCTFKNTNYVFKASDIYFT